jgi:hypothetical protein
MTWTLTDESNYLTRKLAHYNAWLNDPKRKFGTIYPGFPEDHPAVAAEKAAAAAEPKSTKTAKPKAKAEKKAKSTGSSKQDRAVEIFREFNGDRKQVIAAIVERLAMSTAGATTYFYNAKKIAA